MFVFVFLCVCVYVCVLSSVGKGFCNRLVTRPKESYEVS
jgi:hypothetical protein